MLGYIMAVNSDQLQALKKAAKASQKEQCFSKPSWSLITARSPSDLAVLKKRENSMEKTIASNQFSKT